MAKKAHSFETMERHEKKNRTRKKVTKKKKKSLEYLIIFYPNAPYISGQGIFFEQEKKGT